MKISKKIELGAAIILSIPFSPIIVLGGTSMIVFIILITLPSNSFDITGELKLLVKNKKQKFKRRKLLNPSLNPLIDELIFQYSKFDGNILKLNPENITYEELCIVKLLCLMNCEHEYLFLISQFYPDVNMVIKKFFINCRYELTRLLKF
jgi:hypothetical protein